VFGGDVMLGRLVRKSLDPSCPARPWGDALSVLRGGDLTLVNLECALTNRTERWTDGGYKPFYFRADPNAVATLVAAGVDFVSVANNHIGDYGADGLRDTLHALDGAGISYAGAGPDRAQAREPAHLAVRDTRVSVVAFADYPVEWRAGPASPGINYTPVSLQPEDFTEVSRQIMAAREEADLVVFSIHWGPNMRAWPSPEFRAFARAVIDAGADIFWGHSAHVIQGVEFWHGHPILFDAGDLLDDYAVDPHLRNDLSALLLVHVNMPRGFEVEVVPVQIGEMRVSLAQGADHRWFVERFTTRCKELDSDVTAQPVRLRVIDRSAAGATASAHVAP